MPYQRNKMKKTLISIISASLLISCSSKIEQIKETKPSQIQIDKNTQNTSWWKKYNTNSIDLIIAKVLQNNTQINIASINFLSAVARYELINFDLYPSLSGSLGANISKNLNTKLENKSFSTGLNLSYELDIYGKIKDSKSALKFSANASKFELEALKLSIINSTLNNIFEYIYFNDIGKLLEKYKNNLNQSKDIYTLKYKHGQIEELDLLNLEQNILKTQQNIISNQQNKELIITNLKELLGNEADFALLKMLDELSINDIKELNIDFDIDLKSLSYRPDVRASINALNAAFKDYKAMQKSILPSINLGANLSSNTNQINDSFKLFNLGGVLQISLPFLDYGRVKQNIQISRLNYESLLLEYKQSLQSAINEFYACLKDYEYNQALHKNLKSIQNKQNLITQNYLNKYNLGQVELKDYLDAQNTLISNEQELLSSKLNIIKNINLYYQITALNMSF